MFSMLYTANLGLRDYVLFLQILSDINVFNRWATFWPKNCTKHMTFHMHDSEQMNYGTSVNLIITDQLRVFPIELTS